jgi:hypothetical protein
VLRVVTNFVKMTPVGWLLPGISSGKEGLAVTFPDAEHRATVQQPLARPDASTTPTR